MFGHRLTPLLHGSFAGSSVFTVSETAAIRRFSISIQLLAVVLYVSIRAICAHMDKARGPQKSGTSNWIRVSEVEPHRVLEVGRTLARAAKIVAFA